MTKRHPDVREPEEGFIVAEEEVQGWDVLHGTTPPQKGLHMLEKKPRSRLQIPTNQFKKQQL